MAWLHETFKLCQKLEKSIGNLDSKAWNECCIALEKIESELNAETAVSVRNKAFNILPLNMQNKIILQQKELWITSETNKKSVEQILKHLIFYTNQQFWLLLTKYQYSVCPKSILQRTRRLATIAMAHNNCCRAFGQFDLINHFAQRVEKQTKLSLITTIQFTERCGADEWEYIFWHAFTSLNQSVDFGNQTKCLRAISGFMLFFGAKYIENMLSTKSHKQLQNEMVSMWWEGLEKLSNIDAIKLSKVIISWRNRIDIENYGKMFIPNRFEQDAFAPNKLVGNIAFFYAKMHLQNKRYLAAKYEFIYAIDNATSFAMICLSLQDLSKICRCCGEYGIGLKCLKYAYKLCHIDNETPSFLERYGKKKRLFIKKLNKTKCGYCGMRKGRKLRPCSGCMKVMYCNRKCQKKHWKNILHNNCDNKFWSRNYNLLKSAIFN